ncbi:MAG: TonB family protein [Candidatus Aerophobetes bacterium]|nr:TonB family protein [Candidatus Aerophobetes bacterium]
MKKEGKIDLFRLALLISCAVHFSFIILFPRGKVPIPIKPPSPKYFEVSLIRVAPEPIRIGKTIKVKEVKKPVRVEKKAVFKPPTLKIETSGQPEEALPVLPPSATPESEIRVSSFVPGIKGALKRGTEPSFYLPQFPSERKTLGTGQAVGGKGFLPPRASLVSPKEEISYKGKRVEAQQEGAKFRIKGPLGTRGIVRLIEPVYPEWAEKRGIEGSVELKPWVLPGGEVKPDMEILRSSGWSELDECARQALMQWKFEPIEGDEIQGGESLVEFIFTF